MGLKQDLEMRDQIQESGCQDNDCSSVAKHS